jgi:hypothetical protein
MTEPDLSVGDVADTIVRSRNLDMRARVFLVVPNDGGVGKLRFAANTIRVADGELEIECE